MGGAASVAVTAGLSAASEEELKDAMSKLTPRTTRRLQDTLAGMQTDEVQKGANIDKASNTLEGNLSAACAPLSKGNAADAENSPPLQSKAAPWKVIVKTLGGKVLEVDAHPTDLISDLKKEIQERGDLPAEQLRLVYGAQVVEGSGTLAEFGLESGAELNALMVKARLAGLACTSHLGKLGRTGAMFSNKSFTVEAWIKVHVFNIDSQGDNTIIGTRHFSGGEGLHMILRNRCPLLGFYYNDTCSSQQLAINTWTHTTFAYDLEAREQRLYVDGQPVGVGANKAPLSGDYDVFIGTWAYGGRLLNGELFSLNVWSVARDAAEIQESFRSAAQPQPSSEGLTASWTFQQDGEEFFRVDAVSGARVPLPKNNVVEVKEGPF